MLVHGQPVLLRQVPAPVITRIHGPHYEASGRVPSIMALMPVTTNNRGDDRYAEVLAEMAERARAWAGPIVVVAHVDPDGDALGSALALSRALRKLGKDVIVPLQPPAYLAFLAEPGELAPPLATLPDGALLFVLDAGDTNRVAGAPVSGAAALFNVDHHGTNSRFGDLAVVEPAKAATAVLMKELVDALGVEWTVDLATPCLTGILTDTGTFRFGNTNMEALTTAGQLIEVGVDYGELTDRLQWRHPDYFRLLAKVMATVKFAEQGQLVYAVLSEAMRGESPDDDSDDFVGVIRYAEGARVAVLLKERGATVKLSVRARAGASAQRICLSLGGGGHVAAAGATVTGTLAQAEAAMLAAVREELERRPAVR